MKVVFTSEAKRDLREIALHIAKDDKTRAQSFVRELRDRADDLCRYPLAYPVVPRLAHLDVRRRVHRNYLIFYTPGPDVVTILRILHGARDYEALLINPADRDAIEDVPD